MDPFASGKGALERLVSEYDQVGAMNEATTRLRVIDRLLQDVLGWSPAEIVAEEPHGREYADYALGSPATEAILEAKREGIPFLLPAGLAGRHAIELATVLADLASKAAVKQVLGYCQSRGVPIAIICNGHQLVAFFASRQDGVPPLEGRALVFSSLQEMLDDYALLWNHLSRDGMGARHLQRVLLGRNFAALPPPKLADRVHNYPGFRSRSPLETDLKVLGGLFVQDLEDEPAVSDAFLRDCYVNSGALSQYALVSREILRARYDALQTSTEVSIESARDKRGTNPKLTADIMTAAMSRRPLLLLGDVGVGKSMFLRHLIQVEAADVLDDSLVFYIDFGKRPALATELEPYVAEVMIEQMRCEHGTDIEELKFVTAVYHAELNRFRNGVFADLATDDPGEFRRRERDLLVERTANRPGHLRASLEHIRATTRRSAVVVLDNIDQRPSDFQERVFLIGQSMAESWPCTVFVALRPSTFYDSRSRGSLAAYQPRVFTVSPTRTDDVIRRRLAFAREQLGSAEEAGVFPENLSLRGADLDAYLVVLEVAFTDDEALKSLVDNLSGGNLRLALAFLSAFMGSPHVSTQRVLEVAGEGGVYNIPLHEFLRAIILTDYEHYDPGVSEICNLWDISALDGREHFLLSVILAHVQLNGEAAGGDGFVTASAIFDFAQTCGFSQEQVDTQLSRASVKRLLETPQGSGAGGPFRITTIGSYMYRSLVQQFVYVDAMIVDTPIVDIVARNTLINVGSIADRLDRVEVFRSYLDAQWVASEFPETMPFSWPAASAGLAANVELVRDRTLGRQPRPDGRPLRPPRGRHRGQN